MAQLNDLLVMGQSTLLGPVKIDSIIDKNGSNGATNSSTIDKVLKSDDNGKIYWGSADNVTFTRSLTSGTKIGTITINGTATDLYCETDTNTHVNNSAWSSIELNANDSTKLASYGGFIDFHYRNASGVLEQPTDYTSRIIEDANGSLSLNGVKCFSGGTLQFNKLKLPTSSNGNDYGLGNSEQVLKSNGSTVYWGETTSAIVLTKAEFNALTSYKAGALYCITD